MARIASATTQTLVALLRSASGLASSVADVARRENIELEEFDETTIVTGNPAGDWAERGRPGRFPVVFVYCDKVSNLQREKFRCFSGVARLNIELLVSGERQEALEQKLQFYVDAITDVLEGNRGDWGQGIGYGGGYEIQFAALKRGGRNYTQNAKVSLEVDVSQPLSGG